MSNENSFLISYGLHSFVAHATIGKQSVFTIYARQGQKMIRHATSLISECYGKAAAIQVI